MVCIWWNDKPRREKIAYSRQVSIVNTANRSVKHGGDV
jgi:hypothetical protein